MTASIPSPDIPHPRFQVVVSPQYSGIDAPRVLGVYLEYFQRFSECLCPIQSIGISAMSCGLTAHLTIPGTDTNHSLHQIQGLLFLLCLCNLNSTEPRTRICHLCASVSPFTPKPGPCRAGGRGTDEPHWPPVYPQDITQNLPVYLMTFCLPTALVLPPILFLVARACRAQAGGQ